MSYEKGTRRVSGTIYQLAAVGLAGGDLEGNDMALRLNKLVSWKCREIGYDGRRVQSDCPYLSLIE